MAIGSNSAQKLSPNEKPNDSSNDFSSRELSTSKKIAQHTVSCVHVAPEEVFKQIHMIDKKNSTQQTPN